MNKTMNTTMNKTFLAAFLTLPGVSGPVLACDVIAPYQVEVMLAAGADSRFPVAQPAIVAQPMGPGCTQNRYADNGQVHALNNEQLANLGSDVVLAPAWQASQIYVAANRASFQGVNYTAKWWTQGETPGSENGVWVADAANGPQAWSASNVYTTGNQVVFNGKLYEAKWWTQGEQPGPDWSAWQLKGVIPPNNMPGLFSANIRKLADGQWGISFVAMATTTYTHRTNGSCGVSTTSVSDWSGPFGTNWRISLDGVPAYAAALPIPNNSGTQPPPPPPPRLPNGSCPAAGGVLQTNSAMVSQTATAIIPPGSHRFVTVWSCSADQQCRPSELLDTGFMGWAGPPLPQYRVANPSMP